MAPATQDALRVIEGTEQAAALLHPIRMQVLESLREPQSASSLARLIGLPRQKVNYHLRELEKHGFVEFVKERKRGNCVERIYRATARAVVISPATAGALAADPADIQDRFSSSYLTALTAQATCDLGRLRAKAGKAGKRLATFSLQTEVRFRSAAERAAFARELTEAVEELVTRYHDDDAAGGRRFNFLVGGYPKPPAGDAKTDGGNGPSARKTGEHRAGRKTPRARSRKPN